MRMSSFTSSSTAICISCWATMFRHCILLPTPIQAFSYTSQSQQADILSLASSTATQADTIISPTRQYSKPGLSGDWANAKQSLRHPKCCVVSVSGLDDHLSTIQQYFCGDDAPFDLDLRMRVQCKGNASEEEMAYQDCTKIFDAVMGQSTSTMCISPVGEGSSNFTKEHPCILALEELARGVASLADGSLEGVCTDVHMRVVCASNYKAIDPMFHTDKCPLRGYVTLNGPVTEYMDETCLPWEYAALRSFGVDGLSSISGENKAGHLRMGKELDFIVMKGDCYSAPLPGDASASPFDKIWDRSAACVHRSPPGESSEKGGVANNGRRRVILSLDLADGMDDQEWYERSRKRGWRSGMTQRKSRLVS